MLSFILAKKWPQSLILIAAEGWGEKEICTKGVSDGQKVEEELGWAIGYSPTLTVHS